MPMHTFTYPMCVCVCVSPSTQLPSTEEIEALAANRRLTNIVFFLDETFEELAYDVTTTVLEAVEQLAGVIKLQVLARVCVCVCAAGVCVCVCVCGCLPGDRPRHVCNRHERDVCSLGPGVGHKLRATDSGNVLCTEYGGGRFILCVPVCCVCLCVCVCAELQHVHTV